MLRHLQHEQGGGSRPFRAIGPGSARLAAVLLAMVLAPALHAQNNQAQRAIEKLEGCSKQERRQDCVKILKKKRSDDGRQKVKAQVRGERIIWYEFDPQSGRVRRTN